jgi:hypothetical protein
LGRTGVSRDRVTRDHVALPAETAATMISRVAECEAENSSNCLEVARRWCRIFGSDVLRSFVGPSDSLSDQVAD